MSEEKTNIVVIDDDHIYVKVLHEKLSHLNDVFIMQYINGETCMADLGDRVPQILIADHYLNSHNPLAMNGSETMKRLREKFPNLIVIMLSGRADLSTSSRTFELEEALDSDVSKVQELLNDGAYFYVVKDRSALDRIPSICRKLIDKVL